MDKHQHLLEATEGNIGLLAGYAREVIRLFFHKQSEMGGAGDPRETVRGVRVSPSQIAKEFRKLHPEFFTGDLKKDTRRRGEIIRRWITNPPKGLYSIAEMAALFKLKPIDLEIFILVAAPAIDPSIHDMYAYIWNNVHKRCTDIGFICQVLSSGDHALFEDFLARCQFDAPLRRHRLLIVEERNKTEDSLDLNLMQRRIRVADRALDYLRRDPMETTPPRVDENLAAMCMRLTDEVSFDDLPLPDFNIQAMLQLARSKKLPAIFDGPSAPSQEKAAQALAGVLGRNLLVADLTALLGSSPVELEARLAELIREARFGGDLIFLKGSQLPDHIPGPSSMVLKRVLRSEPLIMGVDSMPSWAVSLTAGWPVISIPMPDQAHRIKLWQRAFEGDRRAPQLSAMEAVSRRYEMSPVQIEKAAGEARRIAQIHRHKKIEMSDLDKACRAHFAHQLSDLADLIPPMPFKVSDLIIPPAEQEKFDEILLYSEESQAIYNDWGFGEKFPYGRGLSVLFYGLPGTGKTMGATIIAAALGLDLFRIDLSQIMSRYVGETEKNLARVFDEAERGRVMLLFDEADALFTKRTSVRSSVDRYANLEVAFLLQRMENFEGVTVLTTNVEHNLDDAFKRRIRYRIYFPMPDGETRGRLWRSLMPKIAPLAPGIDFGILGESFEITGGHIKQAVLRAAFYARRAKTKICFHHLVDGAIVECRELGMLVSEKKTKKLERALKKSRESVASYEISSTT